MIISLVINLQAEADGRIHGATGRAVHGFWLNQWKTASPAIAAGLHRSDGTQPFTLSPLVGLPCPHKGPVAIAKGAKTWLRIAVLRPDLVQQTLETWLPRLPGRIEIAGTIWQVSGIALSPQEHPWARQESYADIAAISGKDARQWRFEFHTPAAFRTGETGHLPFPLPTVLLHSWLRRWNAFAPNPVSDAVRHRLRDALMISAYRLKTAPVRYGRRLTIGCVGRFTLRAGKLHRSERAVISTLANYAFYCGSGAHTTQGMGMTQLTIDH
ncbi:MAG TPA: CRISPR-associated endoribonuclease Cas6 [Anaerolineae bacterium]|nr:CRISPR-associated endoribonuclease Cas6 [Anaerolineae bacterium]